MSKKFIKDYRKSPLLGNHGPDNADHNQGKKLKQSIRCTSGAVSTRILVEIYTQQM